MPHRALRRLAPCAAGLASCLLAVAPAEAYCLFAGQYGDFYRWAFPHPDDPALVGPIDIYLSEGALSSIAHTGLTADEFRPILLASLSELNTHLGIATLRYAGEHGEDPVDAQGSIDFAPLPAGITVGSFACGSAYAPCAPLQAPGLAGCAKPPPAMQVPGPMPPQPQHGKYLVSLVPASCAALASPEWAPESAAGRDPLHVLLHELGHALGLDHSNLGGAKCLGVEDGDGQPNPGVMWSAVPAFAAGRRLLRDDIEGLGEIWGAGDRSSLWRWDDAAWFPSSPDACGLEPLGGASGVPASVSSAVEGLEADAVFLAFTDANDRVRVLEGVASGFPGLAAAVEVDPFLRSGATLHPMGMAMGQTGQDIVPFVAWLAGETTSSRALHLRWAVRSPAGDWQAANASLPEDAGSLDRRISAGFDPVSGHFVVSAVTERAQLLIVAVGADGSQAAVTQIDVLPAYDVGPPACLATAGACVLPVMTSEPEGPGHAWLQVAIAGDGSASLLGIQPVNTAGMEGTSGGPGLAVWPSGAGTGVRGVLGERRIASPQWPPNGLMWDQDWHPNDGWPLRIGSVLPPGGGWAFPAVARRLTPPHACGNGLLECDEECDDANDVDGDGCTLCVIDGGMPGDTAGPGGDADDGGDTDWSGGGGGQDTGEEGCQCRTRTSSPFALSLALALLVARRSRRPASQRSKMHVADGRGHAES